MFPQHRAGASFQASSSRGKFHCAREQEKVFEAQVHWARIPGPSRLSGRFLCKAWIGVCKTAGVQCLLSYIPEDANGEQFYPMCLFPPKCFLKE